MPSSSDPAPELAAELLHAAHVAARAATSTMAGRARVRARMIILRRYWRTKCVRCDADRGIGTSRPSSEDRSLAQARRPGSSMPITSAWHHRCGTAPGSHRLRCAQHPPREVPPWDAGSLPQRQALGGRRFAADQRWPKTRSSYRPRPARIRDRHESRPLHLIPGGARDHCPAGPAGSLGATRRQHRQLTGVGWAFRAGRWFCRWMRTGCSERPRTRKAPFPLRIAINA